MRQDLLDLSQEMTATDQPHDVKMLGKTRIAV